MLFITYVKFLVDRGNSFLWVVCMCLPVMLMYCG